jgi:hypothetical protein
VKVPGASVGNQESWVGAGRPAKSEYLGSRIVFFWTVPVAAVVNAIARWYSGENPLTFGLCG